MSRLKRGIGLAGGSILSGLFAYLALAVFTRTLGAAAAAPVAVVWTWWAIASATITFPMQHWIARTAAASFGEIALVGFWRKATLVVGSYSGLIFGVAWLLRVRLFQRDDWFFPALVCLVTFGAAVVGWSRGILMARGAFGRLSTTLILENAIRLSLVSALAIYGVRSAIWYALAIFLGYLSTTIYPSLFRLRPTGTPSSQPAKGFFISTVGSQVFAQFALTGMPLVFILLGGAPAAVTTLFSAMSIFRSPYLVALGMVASLTGFLTRRVEAKNYLAMQRFHGLLWRFLGAGIIFALAFGFGLGPQTLQLIFGPEVTLSPMLSAVLLLGTVAALLNLILTVASMAFGLTGQLWRVWVVAFLGGGLILGFLPVPLFDRMCWMFLTLETLAMLQQFWLFQQAKHALGGTVQRYSEPPSSNSTES